MEQTRLALGVFAFQLLLLLIVSLPAWRASGSTRLTTRAAVGVGSLLAAVGLIAEHGVVPSLLSRVVAPCLLLAGLRLTYGAAYELCDLAPAPRWERWLAITGGAVLFVLWLVDHSPGELAFARARFLTVTIPASATVFCWWLALVRGVPRPWSLGTRYLFWAATLGLLMSIARTIVVLSLQGQVDPLNARATPIAILGLLPTSLLIAVGLILQVEARLRDRLLMANVQLAHDATTDLLTGIGNRRRLETAGATEVARARRYGWPVTVMVLDLDHFKAINDRWGHQAGDVALREVAARVQRALRSHDILARWGGEEFALLLPQCDLTTAESVAQRLLESVREISLIVIGGQHLTISVGVAALETGEQTIDPAFQRADTALYAAKEAGRDRYVISGTIPPRPPVTLEPVSKKSSLA